MVDYGEFVSICEVIEYKKKDTLETKKQLLRLADIRNGSEVVKFVHDANRDSVFSNRRVLRYSEGPSVVGTIGVWKWEPVPDNKNPKNDYHKTSFVSSIEPIIVYFLRSCSSFPQAVKILNVGVSMPKAEKTLFLLNADLGKYYGIYCNKGQLTRNSGIVKLDETVVSLPVYIIQQDEIIDLGNGIGIYKKLSLGETGRTMPVKPPLDIVNQIVRTKLSWPAFKEAGKTRSEFQTVKKFFDTLDTTAIVDEVSVACNCSKKEAAHYLERYVECANNYIDGSSIEDAMLISVIYGNKKLFDKCVGIVEQEWEKEHEPFIKQKEAEKTRITEDIEHLKIERDELKKSIGALSQEVSSKEKLSKDLEHEIEKQIKDAQENPAKLIANMAIYNMSSFYSAEAKRDNSSGQATSFTPSVALDSKDMFVDDNWEDSIETIASELVNAGVREVYSRSLSAYLYSSELNHIPVLLAGPNSIDIANAYSAARYGRLSARFECFGDYNPSSVRVLQSINEPILTITNAFSNNWIRKIPDIVSNKNYHSFIVHPYTEDLQIEPESFFYIALPIYTDFVVDKQPNASYKGGRKNTNYVEFDVGKNTHFSFSSSVCNELRIKPLMLNNMKLMLSGATGMLDKNIADIPMLFALLPYARATGNLSVLLDMIENSDERIKISKDLRKDILDFFGGDNEKV